MPKKEEKQEEQSDRADLPATIKRSDEHAQRIFLATLESARETYGEGGRARRVAYASLKHQYEKKGNRLSIVRQGPQEGPIFSELTIGETRAAIWKRWHEKDIDEAERDAFLSAADSLL